MEGQCCFKFHGLRGGRRGERIALVEGGKGVESSLFVGVNVARRDISSFLIVYRGSA